MREHNAANEWTRFSDRNERANFVCDGERSREELPQSNRLQMLLATRRTLIELICRRGEYAATVAVPVKEYLERSVPLEGECKGVGRVIAGRVVVSGGRDVLSNLQWRGIAVGAN